MHYTDENFPKFTEWVHKGRSHTTNIKDILWKRPKELNPNAKFIDNDFNFDDIDQGQLGTCYFLASLAEVVRVQPEKLRKNVLGTAEKQFNSPDYDGKLDFTFYKNGQPVIVQIDDLLPVVNYTIQYKPAATQSNEKASNDYRLIFCSSNKGLDEFWSALIEKAFAKLQGGYKNIIGGHQSFDYLTGDPVKRFDISSPDDVSMVKNNNQYLVDTLKSGITGIAATRSNSDGSYYIEHKTLKQTTGLVSNHMYTVLGYKKLGNNELIIISNPHGTGGSEWKLDWSDNSDKWLGFEKEKSEIDEEFSGTTNWTKRDGIFCMQFSDFLTYFGWFWHIDPVAPPYDNNDKEKEEEKAPLEKSFDKSIVLLEETLTFKKSKRAILTIDSNSFTDYYSYPKFTAQNHPRVKFQKKYNSSEISLNIRQKNEHTESVRFGFRIFHGEMDRYGNLRSSRHITKVVHSKQNWDAIFSYKNPLKTVLYGLNKGTYKLAVFTKENGFKGDVELEISEQFIAEDIKNEEESKTDVEHENSASCIIL